MAHRIYEENFLTHRVPAWHGLGEVFEDPMNAMEAAKKLDIPRVYSEGIKTESGLVIPDYKAIMGVNKHDVKTCFSVVSDEYHEITHMDFLNAWDQATNGAPIETIGLLGKGGDTLFVSTILPKFEVKGEELDTYLLAYNPLTGKDACTGRVTNVRVVCQNTLNFSAVNCSDEFRAIHYKTIMTQIQTWLKEVWESRVMQVETLKETYQILMDTKLNDNQVDTVLEATYLNPPMPEVDASSSEGLDKLAAWEKAKNTQVEHRNYVKELYHGRGLGSNLPTAKDTAWGLWNGVAEYEDHGKSRRTNRSTLLGAGANRKQLALDSLLALQS